MKILPACIIVGALGGLLGAFFVIANNWMAFFRKFYITKKWQRPLEAVAFSVLTTTFFFWTPYVYAKCILKSTVENEETKDLLVTFTCPDGYYNPLATMFFNTEGGAISTIISGQESKGVLTTAWEMFVYTSLWYLFTITTYGVWVPAGLFLPGMIIGCGMGSLYEILKEDFMGDPDQRAGFKVTPVVIGAGAMMAGYTRLSYSLVVIMCETTDSINLFIPMMVSILVSRAVSGLFTTSLYDRALRTKQMPVLKDSIPEETRNLKVKEFMIKDVF